MRIAFAIALALVVAIPSARGALPPGCTEWEDKDFIHPPLDVFKTYKRIDEYPIAAWCFHGRKAKFVPYDETYARNAKKAGFNVLIDAGAMLEPCRKVGGMKVVVPVFHHPPEKLKASIFGPHGDHPCLIGLVVDDNNPRIYPNVIANAKWITENYPHIMPWDSENPDPRTQSKTTMRVLGTQNYPFLRGHRNAAGGYAHNCNIDRLWGNARNMSVWEIFGGNVSVASIRYQMYCGLAYGAQGLVNFAYTPHRDTPYRGPMYQPTSPLIPKFKRLHDSIRLVYGRHLWGCRCIEVVHSVHGGAHKGAPTFNAGQLVVRGTEFMLVGLLTPEKRFRAKDTAIPEYLMVIDKRTTRHGVPPKQDTYVMLHPEKLPVVEMLDETSTKDAKIRMLIPGFKVRLKTAGGDGVLLRVAPDLDVLLGGPEGRKLYASVNATLAALQWATTPPAAAKEKKAEGNLTHVAVAANVIDKAVKDARAGAAKLQTTLTGAVNTGAISRAQADDTLKRLEAAIAATAAEAKGPVE